MVSEELPNASTTPLSVPVELATQFVNRSPEP